MSVSLPARKLLLLSSSKAGHSDYLAPCRDAIQHHCDTRKIVFIPYAGVGTSYADYTAKVQAALGPFGIDVVGIEASDDPKQAIANAEAIMVGGGNTFQLLQQLYHHQLIEPIQAAVQRGVPYVGWSAGSNIAGLSIRTTNDMPIVEPPSFKALQLVPFQLNPHYSDYHPPGFHGETRDQRLAEFMVVAPETPVLAIPEGTALRIDGNHMIYQVSNQANNQADNQSHSQGDAQPAYVFLNGSKTRIAPNSDCSEWLS